MTNNVNEALAVTQTDRDAAADFYGKYLARAGEVPVEAAFRFGQVDESPLIQAFSRHRIASAQVKAGALREALEDFCKSAECAAGCSEGVSQDDAYSEILSFAGSALAASYARARAALA
jgi:tetratricopeptide (TPR) repeat protein